MSGDLDWGGRNARVAPDEFLFLSSFLFFLFLTFQRFQNCWAFMEDREEQRLTDSTRCRMPPPFLASFSFPLLPFKNSSDCVGLSLVWRTWLCVFGEAWSLTAKCIGKGIPLSGFLGLQILLVCVWYYCFSFKTDYLSLDMPQLNNERFDFAYGVQWI